MKVGNILLEPGSGGPTFVSHKKPTFLWEALMVITIYIFGVLKLTFRRFLWQNASSMKSDRIELGALVPDNPRHHVIKWR